MGFVTSIGGASIPKLNTNPKPSRSPSRRLLTLFQAFFFDTVPGGRLALFDSNMKPPRRYRDIGATPRPIEVVGQIVFENALPIALFGKEGERGGLKPPIFHAIAASSRRCANIVAAPAGFVIRVRDFGSDTGKGVDKKLLQRSQTIEACSPRLSSFALWVLDLHFFIDALKLPKYH